MIPEGVHNREATVDVAVNVVTQDVDLEVVQYNIN